MGASFAPLAVAPVKVIVSAEPVFAAFAHRLEMDTFTFVFLFVTLTLFVPMIVFPERTVTTIVAD